MPLLSQASSKHESLNSYDPSLDDSISAEGTDAEREVHLQYSGQISTFKSRIKAFEEKVTDMEEMMAIERSNSSDYQKRYESERLRSETYMIKWKEAESYKSYADEMGRKSKTLEAQLYHFQRIESLLKSVEPSVEQDLNDIYSSGDGDLHQSVKRLLETHHILTREYSLTSKKLLENQNKQETDRQDAAKTRKKYQELLNKYEELRKVHSYSMVESPSPGIPQVKKALHVDRTPLTVKPYEFGKRKGKAASNEKIDSDVILMQPFGGTKKDRGGTMGLPKASVTSGKLKTFSKPIAMETAHQEFGEAVKRLSTTAATSSIPLKKTKNPSKSELKRERKPEAPKSASMSTLPKAKVCSSWATQETMNQTISIDDDSDDDDFMPLRGNLPGVKIPAKGKDSNAKRHKM